MTMTTTTQQMTAMTSQNDLLYFAVMWILKLRDGQTDDAEAAA